MDSPRRISRLLVSLAGLLAFSTSLSASPTLDELAEQNRRLQAQVAAQQARLDELSARLADLSPAPSASAPAGFAATDDRHIRLSGETGLGFFSTGQEGQFPEAEFRVDDAKLFLEANLLRDVYLFAGLDLFIRENNNENLQLGEFYVEIENLSGRLGAPDRLVNFRLGRFDIPFGEEYLVRSPLENPLVSHSLADIWGLDSGVELHGEAGRFDYVLAVQNGGVDLTRDHDSDKAVTLRIGATPLSWLRVSASAMRTGELRTGPAANPGDRLSAVWFGNGFFRAIGPSATTTSFHANLWQGDAVATWRTGHAGLALGGGTYDDNDTAADNSRDLLFGHLEGVQTLSGPLFAAARYSRIHAPGGYPLVGWGDMGDYFFAPGALTEDIQRISVGLGYRFGPPMVVKIEYTRERRDPGGASARENENLVAAQVGLGF